METVKRCFPTREAVEYLEEMHGIKFSIPTFKYWRATNRGPVYRKVSDKIQYSNDDLDVFARGERLEPQAA